MGGHGGLNILPQKRWNVYRFDNREKVRNDEEAAARQDQLDRAAANRAAADIRLQRLRHITTDPSAPPTVAVKNPSPPSSVAAKNPSPSFKNPPQSPPQSPDTGHINFFNGHDGFSALGGEKKSKRVEKSEPEDGRGKKKRKEEPLRTVGPEDEVYKLGYGVAGKGVKAPWYMSVSTPAVMPSSAEGGSGSGSRLEGVAKKVGKKTIEEMREERVRRERKEKERERVLVGGKGNSAVRSPRRRFMS